MQHNSHIVVKGKVARHIDGEAPQGWDVCRHRAKLGDSNAAIR